MVNEIRSRRTADCCKTGAPQYLIKLQPDILEQRDRNAIEKPSKPTERRGDRFTVLYPLYDTFTGWNITFTYDATDQLTRQYSEAPSKKPNDSAEHKYTFDHQGNILTEFRSGAGGQERFNLAHV